MTRCSWGAISATIPRCARVTGMARHYLQWVERVHDPLLLRRCWSYYTALRAGDGHGPSLPALVERVHDPLLLGRRWSYYTALRAGDGHGPSLPAMGRAGP
ncbi:hypothetical protein GCM10027214_15240 [Stenotrophomonas tumulicola]